MFSYIYSIFFHSRIPYDLFAMVSRGWETVNVSCVKENIVHKSVVKSVLLILNITKQEAKYNLSQLDKLLCSNGLCSIFLLSNRRRIANTVDPHFCHYNGIRNSNARG